MSNLERLRQALRSRGIASFLVSEIGNVQWASGFTGSSAWVLLHKDQAVFVTDSRYTIQASQEVHGMEVVSYANPTTASGFLARQVERLGITQLGFESEFVPYATFEEWSRAFAPCVLVGTKGVIAPLRMIKTPEEIGAIREACALADACFERVSRLIQPGVREYDIGLEIEFYFRRQGAEIAFAPAVVSGSRSAMPHGRPSEKALEDGDFVTLDFGAKLRGLCSDLTRTVAVGKVSDRQREVYRAVLDAQLAAMEAMRPGVPAREVDRIARQVLERSDLAQYFGHGLGHGLGRSVHDFGRMSPSSDDVLDEGQVWTVEPGVYIAGFGGVRIEDDVLVTSDGIEPLTHSPKGLLELSLSGS